MKRLSKNRQLRLTVLAAQSCMAAFAAQAQTDPALIEQTQPKSTIEWSIGRTTKPYPAAANEWSGLPSGGTFGIADFELQGGGAYDSNDRRRWRLGGSDLGTHSKSFFAENGEQGSYRFKLGYDELRRNQSDSYRTPYLGVGGSTLTLPSTWLTPVVPRLSTTASNARGLSPEVTSANGIVAGISSAPTAAQLAQAANVQAVDLAAFNRVDLFTQRTRFTMGWEQEINNQWSVSLDVSSEHKEGIRALVGHADAPVETGTPLPFPVNQDDEKVRVSLSYTGESLRVQTSYELSAFTNNIAAVAWSMWSLPGTATNNVATMSTGAPSNLFQKLQASATYDLTAATKLQGHASYARTWQNEAFPTDPSSRGTMAAGYVLPRGSAEALVVNTAAGLKLVDRTVKNLSVTAGVQYDQRENRTAVDTYIYYDNNTTPAAALSPFSGLYGNPTGLGTNVNINANTPYSKRTVQGDLEATYQLSLHNQIRAGLSTARTDRYCLGTWINCANAADAREDSGHLDWHAQPSESLSGRFGVSYGHRKVEYSDLAFLARVPMANRSPSTATGALAGTTAYSALLTLGLTGYGRNTGLVPAPAVGSLEAFYFTPAGTTNYNNPLQQLYYGNRNRMVEENGLRTYDQADRDRSKVRASVTWQPTESLAVQMNADYTNDDYGNTVYGLQSAKTSGLHLDVTYGSSVAMSASVFASLEDQRTRTTGFSIQTGVNSTATAVNGATAITGAGACYTTIGTRNANYKVDPCLGWSSEAKDRTSTLGASLTRNKLFKGKLDLTGSVIYSESTSDTGMNGGFYVNNPFAGIAGNATATTAAYYIAAEPFPTNTMRSLGAQFSGLWHLSKEQAVRVAYGWKRLTSSDWRYQAQQGGDLVIALPSYETAPSYKTQMVGISYVMSFR